MGGDGKISFHIESMTLGKPDVTEYHLGDPPRPPRDANATDSPDDQQPRKYYGLDMFKIMAFLKKFKPSIINEFNMQLEQHTEHFYFPSHMFGGLFDMNLASANFKFHETYLEMEMDPIFIKPVYDDETEPRFIYEKFKPSTPPLIDEQDYTFKEVVTAEGKVTKTRVRDQNMIEIFRNQVQIFGEVPLILSK